MKKIILSLLIGLIAHLSYSQSVTLTGPSTIEVGIAGTFTATFNNGGQSNITIIRYEWAAHFNGDGIFGPSGIVGSTAGVTMSTEPLIIPSASTTSTIPIIWSDFFDLCNGDKVEVTVVYKIDNNEFSVSKDLNVNINCVLVPAISGPSSIQNCCATPVTFCDNSGGKQNTWAWTVTGGTITSGQGTACITVIPNNTGTLTVACTARRTTGLTAYSRTSTVTVGRFVPSTPQIIGAPNVCVGEIFDYCLSNTEICGFSSVSWSIPSQFEVISNNDSSCIQVRLLEESYNLLTISATVILTGGCSASVRNTAVRTGVPDEPRLRVGFLPCESIIYLYDDANSTSGTTWDWEISGLMNEPILTNGNPGQVRVLFVEGEIFCIDRITVTNNCGNTILEGPFCYLTPDCDGEGIIYGVPIEGQGCSELQPCPDGYDCIEGRCRLAEDPSDPPCTSNLDCGLGYQCINGVCVSTGGDECINNSNCPVGFFCKNGVCVPLPGLTSNAASFQTDGSVNVFPNPIEDVVNFHFTSPEKGTVVLRIYDNVGREILRTSQDYEIGKNQLVLDQTDQLPNGTLFFTLETSSFTHYGKLINIKP